jgi:Ammonium Transporter Family
MGPLWQVREASAVQAGKPVTAHVDTVDIAWLLVSAALVFFMQVGFTALESGLVRSKIDQGRDQELREVPGLRLAFWVFG